MTVGPIPINDLEVVACRHNWTYGDGIRWCEGCKVVEETEGDRPWTSDHWM